MKDLVYIRRVDYTVIKPKNSLYTDGPDNSCLWVSPVLEVLGLTHFMQSEVKFAPLSRGGVIFSLSPLEVFIERFFFGKKYNVVVAVVSPHSSPRCYVRVEWKLFPRGAFSSPGSATL